MLYYGLFTFTFLFSFCIKCTGSNISPGGFLTNNAEIEFKIHYSRSLESLKRGDYLSCAEHTKKALGAIPDNTEALQLLGSIYLSLHEYELGTSYLRKAVELTDGNVPSMVANFIEGLRLSGQFAEGRAVAASGVKKHPTKYLITFHAGLIEHDIGNEEAALQYYIDTLNLNVTHTHSWERAGNILLEARRFPEALDFLDKANFYIKNHSNLHFLAGLSRHHQNLLDETLLYYERALEIDPHHYQVWANVGAAHLALGNTQESLNAFEQAYRHYPEDVGLLNNFGALLQVMNREEEGLIYLKKAYDLDPNMENVLVNLGSYYQDEGSLLEAQKYFQHCIDIDKQTRGSEERWKLLEIRLAVMMSPVSRSWKQMLLERSRIGATVLTPYEHSTNSLLTQY